jgi:hypothetical protein
MVVVRDWRRLWALTNRAPRSAWYLVSDIVSVGDAFKCSQILVHNFYVPQRSVKPWQSRKAHNKLDPATPPNIVKEVGCFSLVVHCLAIV